MSQKLKEDVHASWEDLVFSSIVSIFVREGSLDGTFLDVGLPLDWGVFTLGDNERIYNEYGDCAIPFYQCVFLILGIWFPFNDFEM